jgi:hypothetical protein
MSTILYQTKDFYVIRVANGFEVYRNGTVAATRCASIGNGPNFGLARAIAECDKRQATA